MAAFRIVLTVSQWNAVSTLAEAVAKALPHQFPTFREAGELVAADAEARYKAFLLGTPVPGHGQVKRPSGALAKAAYRRSAGFLVWSVGNTAPQARAVEEGAPARDMKKCLDTAPRARMSKDGHKYLIIPFRHGIPGTRGMTAMPSKVYGMAQQLTRTFVSRPHTRVSATGWTVPAWNYFADKATSRLTMAHLTRMGYDPKGPEARRLAGMVRFGKKGHSSYLTFRVMSQKSAPDSWWRPKQEALPALSTAISQAREAGASSLSAAFVADLGVILGI